MEKVALLLLGLRPMRRLLHFAARAVCIGMATCLGSIQARADDVAVERQSLAVIEPLYRAYRFSVQPTVNPEVKFAIDEIDVPDLWTRMHLQLFAAHDLIQGQRLPSDPFLVANGVIYPFVNSFGGFGLMSGIVLGDAFYYSYSWGSGIHRSLVGRLRIENGKLIRHESKALFSGDMFVEKTPDGRVRIVEARMTNFNHWENPTLLGWIDPTAPSDVRIVDDNGHEINLGNRPSRLRPF